MPSESILDRIERDAQRALIRNAFFRLESALTIAGAILLSVFLSNPFPGWPVWGWPLMGLIAESAIVVSSLTDKNEQQRVIESLFREKYDYAGIRDRELRGKLQEADQYRQRIQQVIDQQRNGVLRDRLVGTTREVYDWIANMVTLARKIETFRSDSILRRDIEGVPREVQDLTARLQRESNPRIREQMESTLESNRRLAENLQELSSRMERAELQLDHSLAALGTVYSQMLLVGSKDVDSDRADRLRADIGDEVSSLQDLVESLNDVYTYASTESTGSTAVDRQPQARRAAK